MIKYPKTKPMLIPYINKDNTGITIGGYQYGIARELIVDSPSDYLEFLKLLDGTRDIKEISQLSQIDIDFLEELLNDLMKLGIIYENQSSYYNFNNEERDLYSRNLNFFAWIDTEGKYYNYWEVLNILKNSKVLILGAGGTGSVCANSLARLGIGKLTIVDYDTVELNNLNRQLFSYSDIGKKKTEALKDSLAKINPFIEISIVDKMITNTDDVLSLGRDYDVLVSCIDKPSDINDILEEYTSITNIPRILGGYASTIVTTSLFNKQVNNFSDIVVSDTNNNYDSFMVNTNDFWSWDNAIISPVSQIAGNLSSMYCFYTLSGLANVQPGEVLHLDLFNVQNKHITYAMNAAGEVKEND